MTAERSCHRPLYLDWNTALWFVAQDPGWKSKILIGGLALLVCPPVGWVLALGFRSLTGERLMTLATAMLPSWRGNLRELFTRGVKSSSVILGYLAPSIILFFSLGVDGGRNFAEHRIEIIIAVVAAIIFPPVVIPALPLVAYIRWPWFALDGAEAAAVLIVFLAAIAVLPSAFLRIAATGRYLAAWGVRPAVRFVFANVRRYVEAWTLSLLVSGVAVILVPLTPWLLFWSYLVILHAFLQVLWQSEGLGATEITGVKGEGVSGDDLQQLKKGGRRPVS